MYRGKKGMIKGGLVLLLSLFIGLGIGAGVDYMAQTNDKDAVCIKMKNGKIIYNGSCDRINK